jgi:hypothetical protein
MSMFCTYFANLADSGQKVVESRGDSWSMKTRVRYNRGSIPSKGLKEVICKCRNDAVPLEDALRNEKEYGDRLGMTVCSNFEDIPLKIQGE